MPKICPRYAQDMRKICPRYARNMPEICPRFGREMCKKKKLGQNFVGQNVFRQNVHYFYESWGKMFWDKMSLGQNASGAKCPLADMISIDILAGQIWPKN